MEIREALQEAIEERDSKNEEAVQPETNNRGVDNEIKAVEVVDRDTNVSVEPKIKQKSRDEAGKFSKAERSGNTNPVPEAKATPETDQPKKLDELNEAPVKVKENKLEKAPPSWKPAAREKWATIPEEIREEVWRRDIETRKVLTETETARKGWDQIRKTIAPYEQMLRAEGAEPTQAIGRLLQTASALRMSSPSNKAQLVAGLIQEFNVPVEVLGSILSGTATQQQQQQYQPQEFRDPRLDHIIGEIEKTKQQNKAMEYEKQLSEVEKFRESYEFFEDLRSEAADIADFYERTKGVKLTVQEAFKKAELHNEEIRSILEQRKSREAALNPNGSTQRAKLASSSVRAQPVSSLSAPDSDDIRSILRASLRSSSSN